MTTQSIYYPTLTKAIWQTPSLLRSIMLAVTGAVLLTIAAKAQIPFYPVPMTMQTFVVLCIGLAYGPVLGVSTVLLYLAAGAAGLPVFSGTPEKGIGLLYVTGPTGGYLIGFVISAAVTGWLAEKGWDRKALTTFFAMLIGNVVIYVTGLLWLGSVLGWDKPIFAWGAEPFLLGDLFKIVLAMIVMPAAWKVVKK